MKLLYTLGGVILLLVSCRFNAENNANKIENDSIANTMEQLRIISTVDTTINNFNISYSLAESGDTIIKSGVDWQGDSLSIDYLDRMVILNLMIDNTNIISNRIITKTDFSSIIPKEDIYKYQLWNFRIKSVSNNGVLFYVNTCIPDTDICYPIDIFVSLEGNFSYTLVD
ncbi:MAG: DUF4738 domain-containing protein [Bacteroidales bacterium]|nr:DUF4738 domain-containing protein [Bacteroidales bacterium]